MMIPCVELILVTRRRGVLQTFSGFSTPAPKCAAIAVSMQLTILYSGINYN